MDKLKGIHVHHILAFPTIVILALGVGIFSTWLKSEQSVAESLNEILVMVPSAKAQVPPKLLKDFTSVDVMKLTKDTMTNQLTDSEIKSAVTALAELKVKYIAVSLPLDSTADYPEKSKPSPRSAEDYTKAWADAIHGQGMNVLWRGTWSGIEGIYNFKKNVGQDRILPGTEASAETDGSKTWLGKTYSYIVSHPSYFKNGDIWAPLPERTEGIYWDDSSFLPHQGGIQSRYALFFNDLKKVSDKAFLKIGVRAYTGWSANNFSEVKSGWLYRSIHDSAGLVSVDYYGTRRTPEEMETELRAVHKKTGKQIFLQEWSDYWNGNIASASRTEYLKNMYAVFQKLSNEGVLMGFNYWGGWSGGVGESILDKTPTGFTLNSRGLLLKDFFANIQ